MSMCKILKRMHIRVKPLTIERENSQLIGKYSLTFMKLKKSWKIGGLCHLLRKRVYIYPLKNIQQRWSINQELGSSSTSLCITPVNLYHSVCCHFGLCGTLLFCHTSLTLFFKIDLLANWAFYTQHIQAMITKIMLTPPPPGIPQSSVLCWGNNFMSSKGQLSYTKPCFLCLMITFKTQHHAKR